MQSLIWPHKGYLVFVVMMNQLSVAKIGWVFSQSTYVMLIIIQRTFKDLLF